MNRKTIWIAGAAAVVMLFCAGRFMTARHSRAAQEDLYTRRKLEAQEHLQSMALKLDKVPVAANARTLVELFSTVSRQADAAADALSSLPVPHGGLNETVRFCHQLSDYALVLALKAAAGEQPSEEDVRQLREVRSACALLTGSLVTSGAGQWETLLLSTQQDADNGMDYPSMIYDGAFSDARHRGQPKALGPKTIDQQQAIVLARAFVGEERVKQAAAGAPTGGAIECFGVTLTLHDGVVLNADVTRQGGQMLWIMPEHARFEPRLTLEECTEAALAFLSRRGFGAMEANHYQVYDGLAVINFVAVQDGVLLYPDLIKVQIRMDTGELVGLESNNYLMNHEKRPALASDISEQEARAQLSPRLSVTGMRLCVIPYRDQEKLCWEAAGWFEDSEYRVYIDASTAEEVQVLQMVDSDAGRLAA